MAELDIESLNKFAQNTGFQSKMEIYDYQYWRNEYLKTNYRDRTDQLMQYFPYEKVMSGLLNMCEQMFNIKFEEIQLNSSQTWDSNVKSYRVIENDQHLSTLFIDPFLRAKKINDIWSYSGRDCSLITDNKPIANLMLNVKNLGQSSVMTFDQVKKLFAEFGKALSILLTRVNHIDQSDIGSLEWDSSLIPNKVMENLVYSPTIIKYISSSIKNGEPLPLDFIKEIKNRIF
jgi:Zn-dependent oligopeptidase